MPDIDITQLNIVVSILGGFLILYGVASVKIKQAWYLGEALPALIIGIALGPIAANFINSEKWGGGGPAEQTSNITLGVVRVMIGVQLVIAGFQLPAKYNLSRWKELLVCLLPVMALMWLCTTVCVVLAVPKITVLAGLVIAACVTCTDPILSQAIAKGPFADMYVARPLREMISSEAGANDGFGFPFLFLATYLIRYGNYKGPGEGDSYDPYEGNAMIVVRHADVNHQGGGVGEVMKHWFLDTWLYLVLLSVLYGAVVGYVGSHAVRFALKRRWIDSESYLLFPTALGLFIVGTAGVIGTDDPLACFVAGNALNWHGDFLEETERRHDEVNNCIDVLMNFGGFMYIGTVLPWAEFHDPDGTGLTIGRLLGLGFLVLIFRRIPAILLTYKLMPSVVSNWREALFMGYFGPIGAGAVFYLEFSRSLFPEMGQGDKEETDLMSAIGPVVYWLVFFSIVVHGLSMPFLVLMYKFMGVKPIYDDAVELPRASVMVAAPANGVLGGQDRFVAYNRFSRPVNDMVGLPLSRLDAQGRDRAATPASSLGEGDSEDKRRRALACRRTMRRLETTP